MGKSYIFFAIYTQKSKLRPHNQILVKFIPNTKNLLSLIISISAKHRKNKAEKLAFPYDISFNHPCSQPAKVVGLKIVLNRKTDSRYDILIPVTTLCISILRFIYVCVYNCLGYQVSSTFKSQKIKGKQETKTKKIDPPPKQPPPKKTKNAF